MWVMMVQDKISDQYLTSGKVSTRSIHRLEIQAFKNFNQKLNILSKADTDADGDADTMVTAITLPVLTYRQANKTHMRAMAAYLSPSIPRKM